MCVREEGADPERDASRHVGRHRLKEETSHTQASGGGGGVCVAECVSDCKFVCEGVCECEAGPAGVHEKVMTGAGGGCVSGVERKGYEGVLRRGGCCLLSLPLLCLLKLASFPPPGFEPGSFAL